MNAIEVSWSELRLPLEILDKNPFLELAMKRLHGAAFAQGMKFQQALDKLPMGEQIFYLREIYKELLIEDNAANLLKAIKEKK